MIALLSVGEAPLFLPRMRCVCVHMCVPACTCVCMYMCVRACVHVCVYMSVCIYIYMFVYVYVDDGEMVKDREDGDGQGSLASLSPWGHKESDTTE